MAGKSPTTVILTKSNPSPGSPAKSVSSNINSVQIPSPTSQTSELPFLEETTLKKKRRKKPAGSKLERQKRREEEKFKSLYGPKDSHIHLISHAVLQKLQGTHLQPTNKTPTTSRNSSINSTQLSTSSTAAATASSSQNRNASIFSVEDFPSFDKAGPLVNHHHHYQQQQQQGTRNELRRLVPTSTASVDSPTTTTTTNEELGGLLSSPALCPENESDWETDAENGDGEGREKEKTRASPSPTTSASTSCNTTERFVNESSSSSYSSILTTPKRPPIPPSASVVVESKPVETTILGTKENLPGTSKKKLSKKAMVISLDDLIVKKSVTKGSRLKTKRRVDVAKHCKTNLTIGNTLDSSGPRFIHRGKIREKPKKKKPTKLKLAIMKTRLDRQTKNKSKCPMSSSSTLAASRNDDDDFEDKTIVDINTNSVKAPIENSTIPLEGDNGENGECSVRVKTNNRGKKNSVNSCDCTVGVKVKDEHKEESSLSATKSQPKNKKGKILVQNYSTSPSCGLLPISTKEEFKRDTHAENTKDQKPSSPLSLKNDIVNKEFEQVVKKSDDNVNIFGALLNAALKESEEINTDKIIQLPKELTIKEKITEFSPQVIAKAKESMHSRKFKPYCDMYVSKDLHGCVIALMKELHRFQDRLYHSDPIKFKTKRRYIHGIKDAINSLKLNKVVLVIFAPDIEANDVEGGLDEKIEEIKILANDKNVPVIYSGNRFILGKPIFSKTSVSVISVLDRQGAEELFQKVLEKAGELRETYEKDLYAKLLTMNHEQGL